MKTFRIGGVHPAENKLSSGKAIETLLVPERAVFPLSQHIGAPAIPVVEKGDRVKAGTKIAEAGGFVSAAIHSSVSGIVSKIDKILDASGYSKPAIFVDVEGDEWEDSIDRSASLIRECNLSSEEIVKRIKDAGIVGMGGACFPTGISIIFLPLPEKHITWSGRGLRRFLSSTAAKTSLTATSAISALPIMTVSGKRKPNG